MLSPKLESQLVQREFSRLQVLQRVVLQSLQRKVVWFVNCDELQATHDPLLLSPKPSAHSVQRPSVALQAWQPVQGAQVPVAYQYDPRRIDVTIDGRNQSRQGLQESGLPPSVASQQQMSPLFELNRIPCRGETQGGFVAMQSALRVADCHSGIDRYLRIHWLMR